MAWAAPPHCGRNTHMLLLLQVVQTPRPPMNSLQEAEAVGDSVDGVVCIFPRVDVDAPLSALRQPEGELRAAAVLAIKVCFMLTLSYLEMMSARSSATSESMSFFISKPKDSRDKHVCTRPEDGWSRVDAMTEASTHHEAPTSSCFTLSGV